MFCKHIILWDFRLSLFFSFKLIFTSFAVITGWDDGGWHCSEGSPPTSMQLNPNNLKEGCRVNAMSWCWTINMVQLRRQKKKTKCSMWMIFIKIMTPSEGSPVKRVFITSALICRNIPKDLTVFIKKKYLHPNRWFNCPKQMISFWNTFPASTSLNNDKSFGEDGIKIQSQSGSC